MSHYTITIKKLQDIGFEFNLYRYPIWDESYREKLNSLILGHYRYHEIAHETEIIFNERLENTMNIIMPKYNKIYSVLDPLDWTSTGYLKISEQNTAGQKSELASLQDSKSVTNSKSSGKGGAKSFAGDTPQSHISGTEDYLTGFGEDNSFSKSKSDGIGNSKVANISETNNKATSDLQRLEKRSNMSIYEIYNNLKNYKTIDMLIIKELRFLFSPTFASPETERLF